MARLSAPLVDGDLAFAIGVLRTPQTRLLRPHRREPAGPDDAFVTGLHRQSQKYVRTRATRGGSIAGCPDAIYNDTRQGA
jgi:hypothetical protein